MEGFPGEKKRRRPKLAAEDIQKARKEGNTSLLSAAGRKGAERANQMKAEKKSYKNAFEEYLAEKDAADLQKLRESTNEHIAPLDPEDEQETG